jgi:hypothetical protein
MQRPHFAIRLAAIRIRKLLAFTSLCLLTILAIAPTSAAADTRQSANWRVRLSEELPLLGHRNWIAIVDSAYPLQTSAGIETVETDADQLEVVKTVLVELSKAKHVRPIVFTDAELKLVPEQDAAGVTAYREALTNLLGQIDLGPIDQGQIGQRKTGAQSLPHEQIISQLDEAGKTFHILVLKTRMTIPYTSVFIRLECGYWSADAEKRLRAAMAH